MLNVVGPHQRKNPLSPVMHHEMLKRRMVDPVSGRIFNEGNYSRRCPHVHRRPNGVERGQDRFVRGLRVQAREECQPRWSGLKLVRFSGSQSLNLDRIVAFA